MNNSRTLHIQVCIKDAFSMQFILAIFSVGSLLTVKKQCNWVFKVT